jgi:crotonobetainyl-CoA:carnitine CoA-transferase CaiB-like acyl-CoA transferase
MTTKTPWFSQVEPAQVIDDPHVAARNMLVEVEPLRTTPMIRSPEAAATSLPEASAVTNFPGSIAPLAMANGHTPRSWTSTMSPATPLVRATPRRYSPAPVA